MKYPCVQFPCANVSGDLLFAQYGRLGLDWEHVDLRYEDILITLFMNGCLTITFYGAAANRRFLKLMAQRRFS